ncbi:hypothetical protein [Polynucleobacter asymbioticus]|jgi:hypothetical protein|uniref:Uncharacterized protein n=1 Tax=Polynucleobacter asymbioticus TaxID=576611 RepID=A0AAC9IRF1_9BURK|nr:hypothetical protein [Polynucleobacter asymbioticus]APB98169.1 hypothetical protein A4F89_01870 [Polynucleobacter asymbioticus]APC00455.1 hypothetical protein AOC25_01875 [Polynucleobacter asymbioticus]
MKINPINSSGNLQAQESKLSASSVTGILGAATGLTRVLIAPVVQAATADLAQAATLNNFLPSESAQALVASGLISILGLPDNLPTTDLQPLVTENQRNALAEVLEVFSKNLLSAGADSNLAAIPVTSLSDPSLNQIVAITNPNQEPVSGLPMIAINTSSQEAVYTLTTGPLQAVPVLTTTLINTSFTLVDYSDTDIVIDRLSLPQVNIETFINQGAGNLTVLTDGMHIDTLTLSGKVTFTATDNQVTSGVTVLADSDSSDVTLYLHGASGNQNSTDFLHLGNGNNFVLDTGTGTVLVTLGSGSNNLILAGTGVSGTINFASHLNSTADFITIAPNGLANPDALASSHFVTIGGLNNQAQSSDALAFLGDMNHQLAWANGSAAAAQITSVAGDATQLSNWISAAQNQVGAAHSIAWFQFGGDTYLLESAHGSMGNHLGDTLVKLSGVTQFTGASGELSIGMLHFVG